MTSFAQAPEAPPAGGAELGEVLLASALAGVLTAVLLGIVWVHRTRRTTLVARAADGLGRPIGMPGWVALPTLVATLSLLTALLGMYWDISLHIAQGRDEGPLANPAHYLILFGLFGVFAAGILAMALPLDERPGKAAVRITRGWYAPVGGLLLAGAGFYALIGFPLDDVWHRLFGQDVTLWGPTHLMLIGGAGLSLVGIALLEQDAKSDQPRSHDVTAPAFAVGPFLRRCSAMGGLLIGLSVFQGEFDFGVPQFRMVHQPLMIAAAGGLALVTSRMWIGRGGAVGAATFFVVVHGLISLFVGPLMGEPTPAFPLYLGSAVVVELVALALLRRSLLFGLVAGAGVGTLGALTEAAWTRLVFPLPWTSDILVEGGLMALVGGVAGGLLGALLGMGLQGRLPRPQLARPLFLGSVIAICLAVANGLYAPVPEGITSTVALQALPPGDDGEERAEVTVRIDPPGSFERPSWVQITAWQGDGLVVDRLEQIGPDTWRSTQPIPVSGQWKTLVRAHQGRTLIASPIWMPEDPAIDAPEVPAVDGETRPFGPEIELLQRERELDVPGWLWGVSNAVVLACSLALVAALAWGVARVSRRAEAGEAPAPEEGIGSDPRPRTGAGQA